MFKPIDLRLVKKSNERVSNRRRIKKQKDKAVFIFLMDFAKYRLVRGRYYEALSEFRLALKIDPANREARSLMFDTLTLLCQEEKSYCYELDQLEFQ